MHILLQYVFKVHRPSSPFGSRFQIPGPLIPSPSPLRTVSTHSGGPRAAGGCGLAPNWPTRARGQSQPHEPDAAVPGGSLHPSSASRIERMEHSRGFTAGPREGGCGGGGSSGEVGTPPVSFPPCPASFPVGLPSLSGFLPRVVFPFPCSRRCCVPGRPRGHSGLRQPRDCEGCL